MSASFTTNDILSRKDADGITVADALDRLAIVVAIL
jgi:hypothetical protein